MEIKNTEVHATEEVQKYLTVSNSTLMRMIKKGLIRCAETGEQYRIIGKELLRIGFPQLEDKVGMLYNKGRNWTHQDVSRPSFRV